MTERTIVGYRCWIRDEGLLYSPYPVCGTLEAAGVRQPWFGDEYTYEGDLTFRGKSGIHAYKTYEDLCANVLVKDKLDWLIKQWSCQRGVVTLEIGTVWLWGTVYEHGNGWRAQHAAVKSIYQVRYWPDFHKVRRLPDFMSPNLMKWDKGVPHGH